MRNCLLFTIDGRHYALPLEAVRRVAPMVEVTPLPEAPPPVTGIVNVGGEVVPVLDLRTVLGGAPRPPLPSDHLLFAEDQGRPVALAIDSAEGVVSLPEGGTVSVEGLLPGKGVAEEIATVAGEMVLIWDLGRLLAGSDLPRENAGDRAP